MEAETIVLAPESNNNKYVLNSIKKLLLAFLLICIPIGFEILIIVLTINNDCRLLDGKPKSRYSQDTCKNLNFLEILVILFANNFFGIMGILIGATAICFFGSLFIGFICFLIFLCVGFIYIVIFSPIYMGIMYFKNCIKGKYQVIPEEPKIELEDNSENPENPEEKV